MAEMPLTGSEIDPSGRVDVSIAIKNDSPTELIYLAAAFCMK